MTFYRMVVILNLVKVIMVILQINDSQIYVVCCTKKVGKADNINNCVQFLSYLAEKSVMMESRGS